MLYEVKENETLDVVFNGDTHSYYINGVDLPSITTLIKYLQPSKYENVKIDVLKKASERGTIVHEKIEQVAKALIDGKDLNEADLKDSEVYNLTFLCKQLGLRPVKSEEIVIVFDENNKPLTIGRYDLLLKDKDDNYVLADIKTTATIDYDAYALQLNAYRMGVEKKLGIAISKLYVFQLRGYERKIKEMRNIENKKVIELFKKAKCYYDIQKAVNELRALGV